MAIAANASATPYLLTFSGTYSLSTMSSGSLFGVTTLPAPYSYSIVYDTALNTNSHRFLAGELISGRPALDAFYGYSRSGVLAADFTFGTQTWTAADLQWLNFSAMVGADLWFNTDLDVATPTECWIYLGTAGPRLGIGAAALMMGGQGYLSGRSDVWDYYVSSGWYESYDCTIQRRRLDQVPEGGAFIPLGMLTLLLVLTRVRLRED